jgi:hypothetical protein
VDIQSRRPFSGHGSIVRHKFVTADPYEQVDHARMEYVPACSSFFFEMAAGSRKVLQPAPVTFFFRDRAFGWNIREYSE